MKKFLIMAVAAFAMVGCAIEDTPAISFYEESYTVSKEGGELIIPVNSTGIDAVTISYRSSMDAWEVDPETGDRTPSGWIKVVKLIEHYEQTRDLAQWDSGIYLNKEKGSRITMIRIIYALCRENLLVDANGKPAPDCRIFRMFGQMMHADFSRYSNDLNRSMEDNTDMYTQTEIFRRMQENFLKRFNLS